MGGVLLVGNLGIEPYPVHDVGRTRRSSSASDRAPVPTPLVRARGGRQRGRAHCMSVSPREGVVQPPNRPRCTRRAAGPPFTVAESCPCLPRSLSASRCVREQRTGGQEEVDVDGGGLDRASRPGGCGWVRRLDGSPRLG
eukprot:scaffold64758_cov31-Tisochrysis_lutea.AAC.1